MSEMLANNLKTLRSNVNQLMEASNKFKNELYLHTKRVCDRLGRVERQESTFFRNGLLSTSKERLPKTKKDGSSHLLPQHSSESSLSEEDWELVNTEQESESCSSEENLLSLAQQAGQPDGPNRLAKDENLQFRKRALKYPGFKETKTSNFLYRKVLSYKLLRLRKTAHECTSGKPVNSRTSSKEWKSLFGAFTSTEKALFIFSTFLLDLGVKPIFRRPRRRRPSNFYRRFWKHFLLASMR